MNLSSARSEFKIFPPCDESRTRTRTRIKAALGRRKEEKPWEPWPPSFSSPGRCFFAGVSSMGGWFSTKDDSSRLLPWWRSIAVGGRRANATREREPVRAPDRGLCKLTSTPPRNLARPRSRDAVSRISIPPLKNKIPPCWGILGSLWTHDCKHYSSIIGLFLVVRRLN